MGNPLISVILPVYNGEKLLTDSIESVLDQNYHPLEIILVDDGSTDGTTQVAARFGEKVRYFYQSNTGPAAARNLGIRNAKGEFIAFIDADDLWPKDKLRMQMTCFAAFSAVEIAQGLIERIKLPNQSRCKERKTESNFLFVYTNLGSMVIRRTVFDKIGYFDETLHYHEDSDFWIRAREAGVQILIQRKVSLIYRIHSENLTTGMDIATTGFLNILKMSIDRRRKTYGYVKEVRKLIFLPRRNESQETGSRLPTLLPLVSVIFYGDLNPEKSSRALESIYKQGYRRLELIFVGSQIDILNLSPAISFERVEYCKVNSMDRAAQLNMALEKCTGELITFLDSEGEWAPEKIKTQVMELIEHPTDGYCAGRCRHILEPETEYPARLIDNLSLRKNLGDLLDTLMVRRLTFEQVGKFRLGLPGIEETDWLLRAADKGFTPKLLPMVLLYRFVRSDSPALRVDQMQSALLESVRASVLRKRKPG